MPFYDGSGCAVRFAQLEGVAKLSLFTGVRNG
jgi:hypothetical protein